jgi:hypothetical protein
LHDDLLPFLASSLNFLILAFRGSLMGQLGRILPMSSVFKAFFPRAQIINIIIHVKYISLYHFL